MSEDSRIAFFNEELACYPTTLMYDFVKHRGLITVLRGDNQSNEYALSLIDHFEIQQLFYKINKNVKSIRIRVTHQDSAPKGSDPWQDFEYRKNGYTWDRVDLKAKERKRK